jgi:hypothetical protein
VCVMCVDLGLCALQALQTRLDEHTGILAEAKDRLDLASAWEALVRMEHDDDDDEGGREVIVMTKGIFVIMTTAMVMIANDDGNTKALPPTKPHRSQAPLWDDALALLCLLSSGGACGGAPVPRAGRREERPAGAGHRHRQAGTTWAIVRR